MLIPNQAFTERVLTSGLPLGIRAGQNETAPVRLQRAEWVGVDLLLTLEDDAGGEIVCTVFGSYLSALSDDASEELVVFGRRPGNTAVVNATADLLMVHVMETIIHKSGVEIDGSVLFQSG